MAKFNQTKRKLETLWNRSEEAQIDINNIEHNKNIPVKTVKSVRVKTMYEPSSTQFSIPFSSENYNIFYGFYFKNQRITRVAVTVNSFVVTHNGRLLVFNPK